MKQITIKCTKASSFIQRIFSLSENEMINVYNNDNFWFRFHNDSLILISFLANMVILNTYHNYYIIF